MEKSYLSILLIVLFYLVGPNYKIAGAAIADILFFIYFLYHLLVKGINLQFRNLAVKVFIVPLFVVVVSTIGKFMIGLTLSKDEINNLIKIASLFSLSLIGIDIGRADKTIAISFFNKVIFVISIAVIFISCLGIFQYFSPSIYDYIFGNFYSIKIDKTYDHSSSNFEKAEELGRISSVFEWSNALGIFLVCTIIVIIINVEKKNFISSFAILLGIIALVLTNSRISLLLMVFSFLYIVILNKKNVYIYLFVGTIVLSLLFLPFEKYINNENLERFEELYNFILYGVLPINVLVRLETLYYVSNLMVNSKFMFFGFPNELYFSLVNISWDNQYLGWFVRYGLLSIILFVWLLLLVIWPIYLRKNNGLTLEYKKKLHTFFLINFIILVGGLSQDTLFIPRLREFYFLTIPFIMSSVLSQNYGSQKNNKTAKIN